MSSRAPEPPEPPTAVLGPPGPVLGAYDPSLAPVRFEEAISSLRIALAIVGVVAIGALGLGIYALLRHDHDRVVRYVGSRHGLATQAEVSGLDRRLTRLGAGLTALRSAAGGTAALPGRVATLERTVRQLAARPAGTNTTQAIAQVSSRVDKLASTVAQLQSSQAQTQTQTQPQTQTTP